MLTTIRSRIASKRCRVRVSKRRGNDACKPSRTDASQRLAHPVCFLETFVDPTRHRGTCYLAANWIVLGKTFGRGHRCPTMQPNRSVKQVLGYPLVKRFRELLGGVPSEG